MLEAVIEELRMIRQAIVDEKRKEAAIPTDALLITVNQLSEQLGGISVATLYCLKSSGQLPLPVKVGGRVMWRREEIQQWVQLGCPPRERFEKMRR